MCLTDPEYRSDCFHLSRFAIRKTMTIFRHMNCVVVLLVWGILIYPLVCVDGFAVNRWAPMRFKLRSMAETSVPPEIARCSAANDLILVERLSAPHATSEGLYIPSVEGKDDMRLGRVLSVPEGQFAVSEKALIPTAKAAPYSIGDIVFIRVSFYTITALLYYDNISPDK